jgi:hypothetical protein
MISRSKVDSRWTFYCHAGFFFFLPSRSSADKETVDVGLCSQLVGGGSGYTACRKSTDTTIIVITKDNWAVRAWLNKAFEFEQCIPP